MIADKILPFQSEGEGSVSKTELHTLTEDEQTLLKSGIMSLHENRLISPVVASWLIQTLGLSNV